jgi:hypothetical protein
MDFRPYLVTADRIGLSPRGSLILHHVLVYPVDSFAEPLVRLDECVLRPNFAALFRGAFEPLRVRISSGLALLPAWDRPAGRRADARLELCDLRADIRFQHDRIDITHAGARCYALEIRATGALDRAVARAPRKTRIADDIAKMIESLRRGPAALPTLVNVLADIESSEPLRLHLAIGGSTTGATVAATLEGGPLFVRDQPIDRVAGRASWRDGLLHIESFHARGPDGLRFDAAADPGPPFELPRGFRGIFAFDLLTLRGVRFSNGAGRITAEEGRIHFTDCATHIGENGERGAARATLVWDPPRRTLSGEIDLTLDPNDFAPFLTSNQLRIARRFAFDNTLPRFSGTLHRTRGPETNLYIAGRLSAESFAYRGVPIDAMQAYLVHTANTLRLDSWHFTRPEGVTTGSLAVPLRGRDVRVSLDSTMHPIAIAGLIGPGLQQALSAWRFEGPVAMRAQGVVDGSGREEITDLVLDVDGHLVGRGRWLAESAQFTLHARRGVYATTNLIGRAYGGTLRAAVRVEPTPAGPEHRYIVHGSLTDADFARLAEGYTKPGDAPLSGRVNLDLQITGLVSDAFGPVTRGGGSLTIEDGTLFRTRLFGGLSDLLSRVSPGLGYVAQTDYTCTYRIEEGAIFSEDIRLEGDLISMRAEGELEFDGRADMRVEVQLLRSGPIAALLRLLTMPVTKLFEFRMTGTLLDPKWRPVNLPKEMFLIFD